METLRNGANAAAREALIRHRTQARRLDLRQRGLGTTSGTDRPSEATGAERQTSQAVAEVSGINPAPLPDSQHPVIESGSLTLGEVAIDPTAKPDWPFGDEDI